MANDIASDQGVKLIVGPAAKAGKERQQSTLLGRRRESPMMARHSTLDNQLLSARSERALYFTRRPARHRDPEAQRSITEMEEGSD